MGAVYEMNDGIKIVVLFDTNAYRGFVSKLNNSDYLSQIDQLIACERKKGIKPIALNYVMMELINHLSDLTDPHFTNCMNSLCALARHTWNYGESEEASNNGINSLLDHEGTIARELIDVNPDQSIKQSKIISALVAHIYKNAPNITDTEALGQISMISKAVNDQESVWVQNMKSAIALYDPDGADEWTLGKNADKAQKKLRKYILSDDFRQIYARVVVENILKKYEQEVDAKRVKEMSKQMADQFEVPLRLMSAVWSKIASKKGYTLEHPKEKRGNYIWDFAICFAIGKNHSIDSADMLVVTDDKRIKEAAKEANIPERVMKLDDYLNFVGYSYAS